MKANLKKQWLKQRAEVAVYGYKTEKRAKELYPAVTRGRRIAARMEEVYYLRQTGTYRLFEKEGCKLRTINVGGGS